MEQVGQSSTDLPEAKISGRARSLANLRPVQPGEVRNPGGRPKQPESVYRLAREHSSRALARLVEIMESEDDRAALVACNAILDRAYGPAKAPIENDTGQGFDLGRLAPERLSLLRALLSEMVAKPSPAAPVVQVDTGQADSGQVIDNPAQSDHSDS